MSLNPDGENAFFIDVDQFVPGHSEMKCGWYAVFQNHYAGQHAAVGSAADIARAADAAYIAADGPDVQSNPRGMSMEQLYSALKLAGAHWQNLAPDSLPGITQGSLKELIRAWLRAGYTVIVAVDESTVHDMALGSCPYSWQPQPGQYTHILTITGLQANGIDFLCRDTANIVPSGVRPGPRHYASTPMELISATVFVPNWLPRPAGATPPAASPAPTPTPAPAETTIEEVQKLAAELDAAAKDL